MPALGTADGTRVAQRRLQTLADSLAAIDLEEEVNQAARLLRAELPTLPDYGALDADHQAYYDVATGLRAAAALLLPAMLRANDGLAKLKTPEFEYTFTVPSAAERQGWTAEISQAVGYLVKLVQSLDPPRQRVRFSMFGAAGVARARWKREYSASTLLRLFMPEWMQGLPLGNYEDLGNYNDFRDGFDLGNDADCFGGGAAASEGDPVDNTGGSH